MAAGLDARWRRAIFAVLVAMAVTAVGVRDAVGEPSKTPGPVIRNDDPKVKAAKEDAEKAVESLKRYWASADARKDRKASRQSFRNLTRDQAKATALDAYGRMLRGGTAVLTPPKGGRIEKYLGTSTAVVEEADGRRGIAVSAVPLTVGDQPVDLSLVSSDGGYRPRNSAASVVVPSASNVSAKVGTIGAGFVSESVVSAVLAGDSVLYPNAAPDTDFATKPDPSGIELLVVLRSPESPQTYRLELDHRGVPVSTRTRDGGHIELLSDGTVVGSVSPAFATDAQGQSVEVGTRLVDGAIEYTLLHRGRDLAYPILIDPNIQDSSIAIDWGDINGYPGGPGGNFFADWVSNNPTGKYWQARGTGALGTGIYQGSNSGTNYVAEDPVNWLWRHPQWNTGTSYVYRADLNGLYSDNAGEEYWTVTGLYSQKDATYADIRFYHRDQTNANILHGTTSTRADTVVFEWRARFNNNVGRQQYLRNVRAYIRDPEDPTLHSVTGTGKPAGWANASNLSVTLEGSDPGIGIYSGNVKTTNSAALNLNINQGCQAHPNASPCPTGLPTNHVLLTGSWSTTGWVDGVHSMEARVSDSLRQSAPQTWTIKLDRTKPRIDLDGALYDGRQESLGSGVYDLLVDADDSSPVRTTSGIQKVEVWVDSVLRRTATPDLPCTDGGCVVDDDQFLLDASGMSGPHLLEVRAYDNAGNPYTSVSWTVNFQNDTSPTPVSRIAPPAPLGLGAGCPQAVRTEVATFDNTPPTRVVNGVWIDPLGGGAGPETTEYFGDTYRVTRCTVAGDLVVSQTVQWVEVPGGGSELLPASYTVPEGDKYGTTWIEWMAPSDAAFVSIWASTKDAIRARVLPPTTQIP
jgi:hypothetical protein